MRERGDREAAARASAGTQKALDTEKFTSVSGLAGKMSAPKRFWHMPTARWIEVDDPEYKKLQTDKDSPKGVSAPKSLSSSRSLSGGK